MNLRETSGHCTLQILGPDGQVLDAVTARNTWLDTYGHIAAMVLGRRDLSYLPASMYVEYENVATASDVVATPVVDKADTVAYYQTLSASSTRDFLRVPVLSMAELSVAPGYATRLAAGLFNKASYTAFVVGSTGVFGRPFSAAARSKVCGIALVATPVPADRTQDIIWGRAYYLGVNQKLVPDTGQLAVTYELTFGN